MFNKDRQLTYTVVYTPQMQGEYKVIVKFATREVSKSPFVVGIDGAVGDATKCLATGPGIEKTGVMLNRKTYFEVTTAGQWGHRVVSGAGLFTRSVGGFDWLGGGSVVRLIGLVKR